jgi:hypothetical protein
MHVYGFQSKQSWRRDARTSIAAAVAGLCLFLSCPALARAQTSPVPAKEQAEVVGRLSGDDVAVKGAVSFDVDNGRSTAMLATGSEVTVRSGQAEIDLIEGGDIAVCGPAHFSILKSGATIVLALDYGRVHLQVGAAVAVTIYTPLVVATPVAIGDNPRDITIGLDQLGELCAIAASGAVRIEQQFTGKSVLVPQGGQINLSGGELQAIRNMASANCSCDLLISQSRAPKQIELSVPIHVPAKPPAKPAAAPIQPPADEPVYRIDMPPLIFDARSPAPPPDPDPALMLLVRESQPEAQVMFQGLVESAAAEPIVPLQMVSMVLPLRVEQKKPGFFARLFGIFHRHKVSYVADRAEVPKET